MNFIFVLINSLNSGQNDITGYIGFMCHVSHLCYDADDVSGDGVLCALQNSLAHGDLCGFKVPEEVSGILLSVFDFWETVFSNLVKNKF